MAEPEPRRLVLASASPRRLHLLRLAGLDPEVRPADVDETANPGEDPPAYVARLARGKVRAAARGDGEVVLAADTTVVLDGAIIGKPADDADAAATLRRLSGRAHTVSTGVAVAGPSGDAEQVVTTTVEFAQLSEGTVAWYVATGEPLGKAGAYGIQGHGAALVARVHGSYTNVVGLPLVETLTLLAGAGVRVPG